ncbi:MAG: hypothetical protein AAF735_01130 [Myxococcota bacterium]
MLSPTTADALLTLLREGIRYRHQRGGGSNVLFIHGWMVSGCVFDGFLEPEGSNPGSDHGGCE